MGCEVQSYPQASSNRWSWSIQVPHQCSCYSCKQHEHSVTSCIPKNCPRLITFNRAWWFGTLLGKWPGLVWYSGQSKALRTPDSMEKVFDTFQKSKEVDKQRYVAALKGNSDCAIKQVRVEAPHLGGPVPSDRCHIHSRMRIPTWEGRSTPSFQSCHKIGVN